MRRIKWIVAGLAAVMGVLGMVFVIAIRAVDLPPPSGPFLVGRTTLRWVDAARPETMTNAEEGRREVVVHLWYPAEADVQAVKAPYVPDLNRLSGTLRATGSVNVVEALGLRFVRSHTLADTEVSGAEALYPVVIFTPGDGTNSAFYSTLLAELASQGYIVAAIDHPYDVGAVLLSDGQVAGFGDEQWPTPGTNRDANGMDDQMRFYLERVNVRAADISFVLDQLELLNAEHDGQWSGRLDLAKVGVVGHSLGGIAATRVCGLDEQFGACVNLDGHFDSSPFYPTEDERVLRQPFMMVTDDDGSREPSGEVLARWGVSREQWRARQDEVQDRVKALYEEVAGGSYKVIIPEADHDSFTDGGTLIPAIGAQRNEADKFLRITSDYIVAFLDKSLRGEVAALLDTEASAYPEAILQSYPAQ